LPKYFSIFNFICQQNISKIGITTGIVNIYSVYHANISVKKEAISVYNKPWEHIFTELE